MASAVADPRVTSPLSKVTMLPASAVPTISGVESFVCEVVVVITGASGAVVSIVISKAVEASEILPAESVAVTVNE